MNFSFTFWRQEGDAIDDRPLHISKPNLSDAELSAWMSRIPADDLLRVRLVFQPPLHDGTYLRAELVEVVGPDHSDAEITAKADEIRKPVTVKHPYFGTFTLNRKFNWYETKASWNSDQVDLSLSLDDCDDETALLASAHELFKRQKTWNKRVRDYAVEELLSLGNDWLQEGEKELTPRTFNARMKLESIALNADGGFEFWFNDGLMFGGHAIMVSGTLADGPTDAGIHG